eukprot:20997_1
MSAKCGKPKSSLWKYATVQPSESGKPKAKCNLCNHVMSKLQCVRQAFNRTLSREVKDIVLGIWEPTYWEDLDYTLTSNKPLQLTLTTLEGALEGFKRLKRAKEYQKYCLFAQELIQIAGNAVKLETSFKTVRIVHNQWRRSLRKDRLAKLVKCHYNIPNIEKVKGMPIV